MGSYDYSTLCRHVDAETPEKSCQVKGALPNWLNGFVMFNGPALTKVGDSEFKHAFDSSALLQKIKIENGNVSYKTKFLQSDTYKKNQKANAITVAEFGTPGPSNKGVLSRLANSIDSDKMMSDNAVLNVLHLGEKFYAVGETPFYFEVDPNSLDIKKRVNMNKAFSLATQTVHVVSDEDGYYYTCTQAVGLTGPKYAILRFPPDGNIEKGKVVTTVSCRWRLSPCYIHSIIMTQNYLILIEPPLAVSLMELLSDVLTNTPFIEGLHWQEEPTIFHVLDRKTWKPLTTSYIADPFFLLHFCNAYEEKNQIVVELCGYKDSSMMQNMFISKLKDASKNPSSDFHAPFCSYLKRFILPLDVSSAQEGRELTNFPNSTASAKKIKKDIFLKPEDLSNIPFEHPTRNDKFAKTGNLYVWGMGPSPNGENYGQIVKLNLQTKDNKIFKEEGFYPSPSIFIPFPNSQKEDEGIILTLFLSSTNTRLLTILFLDAANLTEVCRATLELDTSVSVPLHGCFTPYK